MFKRVLETHFHFNQSFVWLAYVIWHSVWYPRSKNSIHNLFNRNWLLTEENRKTFGQNSLQLFGFPWWPCVLLGKEINYFTYLQSDKESPVITKYIVSRNLTLLWHREARQHGMLLVNIMYVIYSPGPPEVKSKGQYRWSSSALSDGM